MKQSRYSKFRLGKIDLETEKAFLAFIDNFCDKPIWIPRSVVDPETKLIKQWFIDQKDRELKDFMRPKKQSGLEDFIKWIMEERNFNQKYIDIFVGTFLVI